MLFMFTRNNLLFRRLSALESYKLSLNIILGILHCTKEVSELNSNPYGTHSSFNMKMNEQENRLHYSYLEMKSL